MKIAKQNLLVKREQSKLVCSAERENGGMKSTFLNSRYSDNIGIAVTCVGVLLLILYSLFEWTESNSILITGATLTIVGVITHITVLKTKSKY